MKEVDNEVKKAVLEEMNNAYKEVGSDHELLDEKSKRNVGNNGYTLDQQFTLTGKLKVVKSTELKSAFLALETEEGTDLSLQRLMGISSMKNYSIDKPAKNVTRPTRNCQEKDIKSEDIVPEVSQSFVFENCWQPETRDLYDMAAIIRANPEEYKGRVATYRGTVVRQIYAKKDSKQANDGWKKEDPRAMTAQMWEL